MPNNKNTVTKINKSLSDTNVNTPNPNDKKKPTKKTHFNLPDCDNQQNTPKKHHKRKLRRKKKSKSKSMGHMLTKQEKLDKINEIKNKKKSIAIVDDNLSSKKSKKKHKNKHKSRSMGHMLSKKDKLDQINKIKNRIKNKNKNQIQLDDNDDYKYKVGDFVLLHNFREGIICFVGKLDLGNHQSSSIYYGIKLLNGSIGNSDGTYNGIRYFKSLPNRSIFVTIDEIRRVMVDKDYKTSRRLNRKNALQIRQSITTKTDLLEAVISDDASNGDDVVVNNKKKTKKIKKKKKLKKHLKKSQTMMPLSRSDKLKLPNKYKKKGRVQRISIRNFRCPTTMRLRTVVKASPQVIKERQKNMMDMLLGDLDSDDDDLFAFIDQKKTEKNGMDLIDYYSAVA